MTGPAHYQRAEQLEELAEVLATGGDRAGGELAAARARVHATLALVAATIDATYGEPSSPAISRWDRVLRPNTTKEPAHA